MNEPLYRAVPVEEWKNNNPIPGGYVIITATSEYPERLCMDIWDGEDWVNEMAKDVKFVLVPTTLEEILKERMPTEDQIKQEGDTANTVMRDYGNGPTECTDLIGKRQFIQGSQFVIDKIMNKLK